MTTRDRPPVQYAHKGESTLAYQVVGNAERSLLFLPGFVSHLDLAWDEPFLRRFLLELSRFARLIWFDKRGTGLSDPLDADATFDERIDDIGVVLDAAGARTATLFGVSEGASMSMLFAHRNPQRVERLVLFAGFAYARLDEETPWGLSDEFIGAFLSSLDQVWQTGEGIGVAQPSVDADERYRSWFARYLRASTSPGMMRSILRQNYSIDLREILPLIRTPTLVLHRTDEAWVRIEFSRYIAEHLSDAKLVELAGVDHWPWLGDSDAVVNEIEAFMTGVRRKRRERPPWGPESLTHRERQVAKLAVDGLNATGIAGRLGIGVRTVETHLANAYLKLDVSSKVELARRADEFGL